MSLLTAGLVLAATQWALAAAPPAPAGRARRGPVDSRDEFLLAQPRLTLPATSPDVLPAGETRVRLAFDWGNDFGYRPARVGGERIFLFLVDGEHRSASLQVRHAVSARLTAEARLPLLWRGGGVLDGLIDAWHRLTHLPDSNRPQYPRDQLRVLARDAALRPLAWSGSAGTALGNLELAARWSPAPAGPGWSAGLAGRLQLPTATSPYDGGGVQAGVQALAARGLGAAADLYLGLGGTLAAAARQDGLEYARARPQGFLALEWRPGPAVSLLAQGDAGGRLVRGVEGFPGFSLVLKVAARVDVAAGWRVEGGFTEGLSHITNTTDFGVMVGLERSFRTRRD